MTSPCKDILNDRFDSTNQPASVERSRRWCGMMMTQAARDKAAGLEHGGYVAGYRGSP
jgi:indolepyruvate ferredoxin oxidoreductase